MSETDEKISPANETGGDQLEGDDLEEVVQGAPSEDLDRTVIRSGEEEKTPSRKAHVPYLVVVQGPRAGTRFTLSDEKNIVGRAPGCAVRLDDQSVSRQHAQIVRVPGGWSVADLDSKNGTYVNKSPVTEPVIIGHKDLIKIGIYLLRLVTQEISLAEEMTLPADMVGVDSTVITEMPPADGRTVSQKKTEEAGEGEGAKRTAGGPPEVPPLLEGEKKPSRLRKFAAPVVLALIVLGAVGYFAQRFVFAPPPEKKTTKIEKKSEAESGAVGEQVVSPSETPAGGATQSGTAIPATQGAVQPARKIPVFLDFASSPMPATITFQDKTLGQTPLRVNVELESGRDYEVQGEFAMTEIGENYVQRMSFKVDPEKPIVPLLLRAPIGMLRVDDLPRDVQFYLEGKFEYDRFNERPAKLNEVVLRKPIYIPFGSYAVELRRARQLGESQTFVQDIVYRREFTVSADNPSLVMSITDDDLKAFPVVIRSEPPNADVFIDSKKVGVTPYEGIFPLGEHTMTLRKDGYFEYSETLKVDMNTPFATNIQLKTSIAGGYINTAQAAMNRAMYSQAIASLAEALNNSPTPNEAAKINFMLGTSYYSLGDFERARGYFEFARSNEEQKFPAMLGLVRCYKQLDNIGAALPLIVEVMLNAKDETIRREANTAFQMISPFKSVVYIYTDPQGAYVTVNDKKVEQPTPLILHDMSLGGYKLVIEKPGYQPVEMRLNLTVNEFSPVIVTLKPIPR